MSKLREKPLALKIEHPAHKKINLSTFFYICGSFLPSWVWIRNTGKDNTFFNHLLQGRGSGWICTSSFKLLVSYPSVKIVP